MNEYTVFFELYGKKMKVKIIAESEEKAKKQVMKDIKFYKVISEEIKEDNAFEKILNILNIK